MKRDEWEMVRLGDVCSDKVERVSPKSFSEIYYVDISSIDRHSKSVSSPQRIRFETAPASARQLLKKTDILISTVRPNLNAVAIHETDSDIPTIGSTALCVLRCCDTISFRYVFHFTQSDYFIKPLVNVATGACYPTVKNRDVLNVEIPLPPLDVQRRIAETLDKVTELISLRKTQLEKLDELVKARFVEMFGDPVINTMGWNTDTVQNLCRDIYGGGTPSKAHPEYYENGDIPWVSSKDVKTDVLYDSQIKINQLGVENSTTKMVPVNSVIMVIRSGILKHTLPVALNAVPITVNQDLKVFIPNYNILPMFLLYLFKLLEKDILTGVRAVTADNIEFNSLKERLVIVPQISLQNSFASFVSSVEETKAPIQQSIDTLETLKKSLMQEYFG